MGLGVLYFYCKPSVVAGAGNACHQLEVRLNISGGRHTGAGPSVLHYTVRLLQAHPATFYHYEPLHQYGIVQVQCKARLRRIGSILSFVLPRLGRGSWRRTRSPPCTPCSIVTTPGWRPTYNTPGGITSSTNTTSRVQVESHF